VRGNEHGWTSFGVAGPLVAGVILLVAFVLWELRAREPMVPMRFFRQRGFSAADVTSLLMSFGMFGSIFLLAQFFQIVKGYSPLEAGLLTLPWTGMPIFVAGSGRPCRTSPSSPPLMVVADSMGSWLQRLAFSSHEIVLGRPLCRPSLAGRPGTGSERKGRPRRARAIAAAAPGPE
jgi:hypothetical protein